MYVCTGMQLAEAREQKAGGGGGRSGATAPAASQRPGSGKLGAAERAPASWRWEKQELERQLKDYRKKLDDIYAEMKRNQVKWKAAGEDIARVRVSQEFFSASEIAGESSLRIYQYMIDRWMDAVVKVRGHGGLSPLLRFEPPAIV